jgi:hypothetical protein
MSRTQLWWYFWTVSFATATLSFAFIAAVVLVRGISDLRRLLRTLEQRRHSGH